MESNNSHINNRLKKLRRKLVERGLDAALVAKREHYFYLSGFTGTAAHLIITQNDAVLVTDFRYTEQASKQAELYEIVQYQSNITAALSEIIKKKGIKNLGFEESFLTYDRYSEFKEKLGVIEFKPFGGTIEKLRTVKDVEEIKAIKEAVRISDMAFNHIIKFIKPGTAEIELSAELEYFMKKQGAAGPAFETIVASGQRSAMPHGVASEKRIQSGEAITFDFGAIYKGYCSDITRTVFLGKPHKVLHSIYDIVLDAQLKSLESAHRGLPGKEIDSVARDLISKSGYGSNFGHGLGHGVGLEIHEEPRLSPSADIPMDNGMTVTVEPGIYLNGIGGVRIEDLIVINDEKPIVLTEAPKEMIVI